MLVCTMSCELYFPNTSCTCFLLFSPAVLVQTFVHMVLFQLCPCLTVCPVHGCQSEFSGIDLIIALPALESCGVSSFLPAEWNAGLESSLWHTILLSLGFCLESVLLVLSLVVPLAPPSSW